MLRLLSILILSTLSLAGADYLWPVKAKPYLSATFCEYRDGHFHAGLDVKTWGEMGVPCQAIASGYVERISAGYWGYGKVLFLKLDDGRRAVYAHLDHFTPEMEKLLRAKQKKIHRYAADIVFAPNEKRVRPGDILAWSGTSGTRFPHLHFEVRDSANIPLNPMQFYSGIRDRQPPEVHFLAFAPLGEHSTINGSQLPHFIRVSEARRNRDYLLDEKLQVAGTFGIEFNSHDVADGTLNKYAVYRARFFIDDSLAVDLTYDQLPFESSELVSAHRPLYANLTDWRFTRLYQNGSQQGLAFFHPDRDGYLQVPPGEYRWHLSVEDYQGNQTTVRGKMSARRTLKSTWNTTALDGAIYRFSRKGDMGYPVHVDFQNGRGEHLNPKTIFYNLQRTSWEFELSQGVETGVQAISRGDTYAPEQVHLLQPQNQKPPDLSYEWVKTPFGQVLKLETNTPWCFPPAIELVGDHGSMQLPVKIVSDKAAESRPLTPPEVLKFSQFTLSVTPDTSLVYEFMEWQRLQPGDSMDIALLDKVLRVHLRAEPADEISFFNVDTLAMEIDGVVWPGFRITQPEGTVPITGSFRFFAGAGEADDWHLYKRQGRRLVMLNTGTNGPWLVGNFTDNGEFLLLADTTPPALLPLRAGTTLHPGDKFIFKVSDNLPERAAPIRVEEATLNGEPVYPDYNPLRQEISYWLLPDMSPGSYILDIKLADQAGNRSVNRYEFNVR